MIEAYKRLWPDRKAAQAIETQSELERSMLIELRDELTHPRVRKSVEGKLAFALQRIAESDLSERDKEALIQLYKKLAAH